MVNSFNPRPPCGERYRAQHAISRSILFQSAPPLRGAIGAHDAPDFYRVVSIRAPLAGSDEPETQTLSEKLCFNPRPPCGERSCAPNRYRHSRKFQSAPPLRGAITSKWCKPQHIVVSIRAPLAGSDFAKKGMSPSRKRFNPRPPCGERCYVYQFHHRGIRFQSAPPLRGAISDPYAFEELVAVSIRAPLAGSDWCEIHCLLRL